MAADTPPPTPVRRPRVAVVVGAGGIKSGASIPLFEFLDDTDTEIDLIVSCSGGSIYAGIWATTWGASVMREYFHRFWTRKLFAKIDYGALLAIAGVPFCTFDKSCGLIKPDTIHQAYSTMYGETRLEEARTRTLMQATDALTGEPVLLSEGLIRRMVYASGALVPILPAVQIDGRWLIDGAFSSPLPLLAALREGVDVVISMSFEEKAQTESKGFLPWFTRTSGYSQQWLQRAQVGLAVDMHHYEIVLINVAFDRHVGLLSVESIPEILDAGTEAVAAKKQEILDAIRGCRAAE